MAELTESQEKLISEFTEAVSKPIEPADDNHFFRIPFVAMNDGETIAQVRAENKGLYKDIQRSPFIRRTGVFSEDGTIEDIDLTSLVYYGTLEQAKIAPTLENVDIKLYFREPKLKKVPDEKSNPDGYADSYIWREIPAGFHVYNNDTVYGYEWLVLQDDYTSTGGIYNLHMNIEDGLGVCKFAGTTPPVNLRGVQYKIIITAKNLWTREYSLQESNPLAHTLNSMSDEIAPSVKAVRDFYAEALETLKVVTETLYVGSNKLTDDESTFGLIANNEGIVAKKIKVSDIEDLAQYVKDTQKGLTEHINTTIDGAVKDTDGKVKGVHGILNTGATGNIDAAKIAGAPLSNGQQTIVKNVEDLSYVPFVSKDDSIGIGTEIKQYGRSSGKDPALYLTTKVTKGTNNIQVTRSTEQSDLKELLDVVKFGNGQINFNFATDTSNNATLKITAGNLQKEKVTVDVANVNVEKVNFGNGEELTLDKTKVQSLLNTSTIAYKTPVSELLGINIKDQKGLQNLKPNTKTDIDGNIVEDEVDMSKTEDYELLIPLKDSEKAFDKLGSALQALYELPMSTFEYKRGQEDLKTQLGIFIERVNQIRDNLKELAKGEDENGLPVSENILVHKRNTLLRSDNKNIRDYLQGEGNTSSIKNDYTNRVTSNAYTYTDAEVASIIHYLDLTTSKKELNFEIRNTVGILLKAAKEAQERLLNVETAVYGWDASTVPGDHESKKQYVESHIDERLREQLNNSPFLLGLNRLMRIITLELFDTTDLEDIDAEIESRVTDSDTLKDKVTIKSRMDQVDEIASTIYSQVVALITFYHENVINDESGHTYTNLVDKDDKLKISESGQNEQEDLLDNVEDDHSEEKDRDQGRTWKNLPSKNDLEKIKDVGFLKVDDSAHKHTPNKEETGLVRIPELVGVEHDDVSEYQSENEGVTIRNWSLLKVDKVKNEDSDDYKALGTYKPIYRTKAVAWDSAKLERMNVKLSEVTKAIYGTDDVIMKYPNRTEVLRRNITNLIDDLYPNRTFDVENYIAVPEDTTATFYLPFKSSKNQHPKKNQVAVPQTDEGTEVIHTSLLTWFDNALFNYEIENHYIGTTLNKTKFYDSNKQIKLNAEESLISFDTSKLITDVQSFDPEQYGTYRRAVTRLELLESLIGTEDCYIADLYDQSTDILDTAEDKYKNKLDKPAYTNVAEKMSGLRAKINTLTAQIKIENNELTKLKAQKETLENQQSKEEAELTRLDVQKTSITEAKDSAQKAQNESKKKVDAQSDKLTEKVTEVENTKEALSKTSEYLTKLMTANIKLVDEASKLSVEKNEYEREIFSLEIKLRRKDITEAEFDTQKAELEKKIKAVDEKLEKVVYTEDGKTFTVAELDEKIKEVDTSVIEKQKKLDELLKEQEGYTIELNDLVTSYQSAAQLTERLENDLDKVKVETRIVRARKAELINSIEQLSDVIEDLEDRIKDDTVICEECNETLQGLNSTTDYADPLPYYQGELSFVDLSKDTEPDKTSDDMLTSSNVGYILSRKSKKIQARLSTVEAYLDGISKMLQWASDLYEKQEKEEEQDKLDDFKPSNKRFEASDILDPLERMIYSSAYKNQDHMIYDLDLSESFKDCAEHNRKVWQLVQYSKDAKKTAFTLCATDADCVGQYTITGKLAVNPSILPIQDKDYIGDKKYHSDFTITVKYINKKPDDLDKSTVYLKGKVPTTNLVNYYKNNNFNLDSLLTVTSDDSNTNGWQNQTEYNIYKTINNLFTSLLNSGNNNIANSSTINANDNNLYYQLMKLIYPVGSIYIDVPTESGTTCDPAKRFGGTWRQLSGGVLMADTDASNVYNSVKTNANGNPVTGASTLSRTSINYVITSHSHTASSGSVSVGGGCGNSDCSFSVWGSCSGCSIGGITGSASNNGQAYSTATYTNESTLSCDKIPRIKVQVWLRIA